MTNVNENRNGNAPIKTIRDGSVSAKIWRNEVEGQPLPFYSVVFQKTYTDQATQQVRETHSFNNTDILKVQALAPQAYQEVTQLRAHDRAQLEQDRNPQQAQQQTMAQPQPQQQVQYQQPQQQGGLSQQRDAVMNATPQNQQQRAPAPQREPEM